MIKLADILFSAALSLKLPPEGETAIRSVAFLIHEQAEEDFTTLISDKLIDRLSNKLSQPIDKLSDSVTSAKNFLDATSQQQANELLTLQNTFKQYSDLSKSFVDSSEKLTLASSTRALSESAWPPLSTANRTASQVPHPASLLHSQSLSPVSDKLRQCVSLASKQLLIEYGPLDEGEAPRDKSIEAQRELRQLFNNWIDNCTFTPDGEVPPPPPEQSAASPSSIVPPYSSNLILQFPKTISLISALTMITYFLNLT